MKTKDGPPFFNEGDEGGGKITKALFFVILRKSGLYIVSFVWMAKYLVRIMEYSKYLKTKI